MNQCATKHPKAQPLQERLARFVERLCASWMSSSTRGWYERFC